MYTYTLNIAGINFTQSELVACIIVLILIMLIALGIVLWKMANGTLPGLRRHDLEQTMADWLKRQAELDRSPRESR